MEFSLYSSLTKAEWNAFVLENGGSFLQSWEWGEFQKKEGRGLTRAVVNEEGRTVLVANIFHHPLPFKKWYWYVPYGPIVGGGSEQGKEATKIFLDHIGKVAPRNVAFVKVEPDLGFDLSLFRTAWKRSPKDVQVPETLIMNLTPSEEELLLGMKQKTRYNIKLALRHSVKVVSPDDQHSLDPAIFLTLLKNTAKRQGFHVHEREYYLDMMNAFLDGSAEAKQRGFSERLFYALYENEVVAAALVGFWGKRATYLHGASSETHRNVMAPYLLHWEIMRWTKARGCSEYDFWGVDTSARAGDESKRHWEGISRFKTGFGGVPANYCGAHDLSLRPIWYDAYTLGRKLRWR